MTSRFLFLALIVVFALTVSCAPAEEAVESEAGEDVMADESATDNPLGGTWSGDWGPSPEHRNAVTLDLDWNGTALTGTVNPGPNEIALTNTSFDPATGRVTMEASATNFRGEAVHYMIDGQLDGDSMTGSWTHAGGEGTFSITKN